MESTRHYIASIAEYLSWDSNDASKDTDEDETEQDNKPNKSLMKIEDDDKYLWVKRTFMKRSKKSIVRMIASYVMWTTNKQEPRKRRKFSNRSLVRMIASKLPLKPSKRAYFQIFCESNRELMSKAKTFVADNFNNVKSHMPEMGLADIGLFTWDGFDEVQSSNRKDIITRSTLDSSGLSLSHISEVSHEDEMVQPRCIKKGKKMRAKGSSEKKITALEDELANLRAQIAMIVSVQSQVAAPPPPPPPPPPPVIAPPQLPVPMPRRKPQNKTQQQNTNAVPSMTDVLVGLSSIKLKSSNLQRSPGGTPLKVKSVNDSSSSNDPADIIANALRKKFAKARRSIGSPATGKENQQSPNSGFSPTPPSSPDVMSPITSSPQKDGHRRSRRRQSNKINGRTIVLSPVNEN